MSASVAEIQELADQILERLGTRIRVGQVVICYHEGRLTRVETNIVHKPVIQARAVRRCRGTPEDVSETV